MAEQKGVPWYVKTIVYIAVPIGVLVLAYKLIMDWLMGPVNAVKDLWQKEYEDYVAELKQYSKEDGGNLTAEHQTILDQKTKVVQQTEATLVQITGQYYGIIEYAITLGFVVIVGYLSVTHGPEIIAKWKGLVKKGDVQTGKGQGYIAVCMLADDLAAQGYTSQATALVTTMLNRFNTVDAPFMQSQIAYYQSQLPLLVGWQLLYAQFVIQAYTTELATIPIWWTYLPPPILAGATKT